MTLKEFYDQCIRDGATDDSKIVVEHRFLRSINESSTFTEKDIFTICPDTYGPLKYTSLKEFCDECRTRGCNDDTHIRVFYCHIESALVLDEYIVID